MNGFSFEFIESGIDRPQNILPSFKPYEGLEDQFQTTFAEYLDLKGIFWFHAANERKTKIYTTAKGRKINLEGMKLKRKGVKPGVPDCLILDQRHGYSGFAIELKRKGNYPSTEQKHFLENLKNRNWLTLVTYSLDEAIHWVEWYFNPK